jgi:hypothetical protein
MLADMTATSAALFRPARHGLARLPSAVTLVLRILFLVAISVSVSACVVSEKPLLQNSKPTLGPRFTVQLFRKFSDGRAHDLKTSIFEWKEGVYVNTGGSTMDLPRFVAQPLSDDFIIQSFNGDKKLFTYWIGRKITSGAYLVVAMNEDALPSERRDAVCQEGSPSGFCVIDTAEQLGEVARATAKAPIKNAEVAIIVSDGLKADANLMTAPQASEKGL